MKRILIGGLGRSGTTIVLHALYRHDSVFAVPVETKFLVEEDGFAALASALTDRFSIPVVGTLISRFEHLMLKQVTGQVDGKFRQQEKPPSAVFDGYDAAVRSFLDLIRRQYYFADPDPLYEAMRTFCRATFGAQARRSGKAVWVEKTPANIWRIPFLRTLWPDCYIVHALRDPRDVFVSMWEREAPGRDFDTSVRNFAFYLEALQAVRASHTDDAGFVEVRLEHLRSDPAGTLARLAAALDLAPFSEAAIDGVRCAMTEYYRSRPSSRLTLSTRERALIETTLKPGATLLGYDAQWSWDEAGPNGLAANRAMHEVGQ